MFSRNLRDPSRIEAQFEESLGTIDSVRLGELNKDAEKALALLKVRIGEKIGHIKSAIDVTSRFMDDKLLEDKAKSAQALELIDKFDLGADFHYANAALKDNQDKGSLKGDNLPDRYKGLLP